MVKTSPVFLPTATANCYYQLLLPTATGNFFYLSGEKEKIFRGKDFFFTPPYSFFAFAKQSFDMDFNQIQELIRMMSKYKLSEFSLKEGDFKLVIRNQAPAEGGVAVPVVVQAPPQAMPAPPPPPAPRPFCGCSAPGAAFCGRCRGCGSHCPGPHSARCLCGGHFRCGNFRCRGSGCGALCHSGFACWHGALLPLPWPRPAAFWPRSG